MEENLKYYIAGLIDGEGTITLSKTHKHKKFRTPVVSCSSTTLRILEILKEAYGGHISKQKVYQDHHKQSWSWKATNHAAIRICNDLNQILQEPSKAHRAFLISSMYPLVTKRNGRYTEKEEKSKFKFEELFFHPSTSGDLNLLRCL